MDLLGKTSLHCVPWVLVNRDMAPINSDMARFRWNGVPRARAETTDPHTTSGHGHEMDLDAGRREWCRGLLQVGEKGWCLWSHRPHLLLSRKRSCLPKDLHNLEGESLCAYPPGKKKYSHATGVCLTPHVLCATSKCWCHFSRCLPSRKAWMSGALQLSYSSLHIN